MNIVRDEQDSRDRRSDSRHSQGSRSGLGTLSAERLEQIRERLRERAYDSPAVIEATVRGILGSGDI
jgi:hypothetical protein